MSMQTIENPNSIIRIRITHLRGNNLKAKNGDLGWLFGKTKNLADIETYFVRLDNGNYINLVRGIDQFIEEKASSDELPDDLIDKILLIKNRRKYRSTPTNRSKKSLYVDRSIDSEISPMKIF